MPSPGFDLRGGTVRAILTDRKKHSISDARPGETRRDSRREEKQENKRRFEESEEGQGERACAGCGDSAPHFLPLSIDKRARASHPGSGSMPSPKKKRREKLDKTDKSLETVAEPMRSGSGD
ncbi:UNVERIFIED_CONTAM: hypothetical protein HHA_452840 [Hammondia hammondi]|eukprot:XP_008886061.1 hypothetical protein HHA_452840 [Hammondia hammondi]